VTGAPTRALPLSDVRIVALEQFGAGPFGSLHLADLGAEVIKIEDPKTGGDVGRYVPPYQSGESSLFFETFNRNKRSINLDINSPSGREVFNDLVAKSDVVFSNLRGDVPEKLGIRYEDLKHLNPSIVCCSLTGFGMTGPRASTPGYDYLIQGLAGWMAITGEPGGPPTKTGLSLVDFSGGHVAALSILAGLHAARRDGVGCDCDVSLYDNAFSLLGYIATWTLNTDYLPERHADSAHPSIVPFQNFRSADGWFVMGCPKEKFWIRLVDTLGIDSLRREDLQSFEDRSANRDEVIKILVEHFLTQGSAYWLSLLTDAGVPCAPILSVSEAFDDPQVAARQLILETEHPTFGKIRQIASPVRVGSARAIARRAPDRGGDNQYVLDEVLGYQPEKIDELADLGAFGRT
jgi:crotonobetainyl-CoA:carnitine CoA-transferase CaiB-like acyl-CoA transferase